MAPMWSLLPAAVVLVAASLPGETGRAAPVGERPNVIVILADDLGYADLGVHGATDLRTPHLDALAASGARFTAAYVTCPICAPSRAALLTGRYPQRFGFEDLGGPNSAPEFGLPETEKTLAAYLRPAGYTAGVVGKWDLGLRAGSQPNAVGFDFFFGFLPGANNYIRRTGNQGGGVNGRNAAILRNREVVDEPGYLTDAFGREAAGFVDRHARQRFFLYLSFNAPHTPMEATPRFLNRFPQLTGGRRTYAAMVSAMDDAIGGVLDALERHRLRENTLIFFLSDNGGPSAGISTTPNFSNNRPLRGYKATFFEGGIRVPFFVSWPARVRAGQVRQEIVSSLDVLPTALAAAGLEAAGSLPPDGINLLPGLRGNPTAPLDERVLYWRYFGNTAIRAGAWKLLRIEGQLPQLYQVGADPAETRELAATEGDRARSLARRTDEWLAGLVAPRWQRRFVEADGRVVLRPLPLAEEHAAEARK